MKLLLFGFIFSISHVYSQEKILISYFKPFGGSSVNHTEVVAKKVKEILNKKGSSVEIVLCPLNESQGVDVSFYSTRKDLEATNADMTIATESLLGDVTAFSTVKECLENTSGVTSVYSMGESSCDINYETLAYNAMKTGFISDQSDHNNNLIPKLHRIDESNTESLSLGLDKNIEAFCVHKFKNNLMNSNLSMIGTDPGNYVCNNLSYNMQKHVIDNELDIDFQFIHIPLTLDRAKVYCPDIVERSIGQETEDEKQNSDLFSKIIADDVSGFIETKSILSKKRTLDIHCNSIESQSPQAETLSSTTFNVLKNIKGVKQCIKANKDYIEMAKLYNEEIRKGAR